MTSPARKSGALLVAVLLLGIFVALAAGGYLAYRHLTAQPDGQQQASTENSHQDAAVGETRTANRSSSQSLDQPANSDGATATSRQPGTAPRSARPSAAPRNSSNAGTASSSATEQAASEAAPVMPQGWELPADQPNRDAAIGADNAAITTSGRRPAQQAAEPLSGVIIWSGQLRKNAIITIDGETASVGMVRGELPGVPVTLETAVKDIGFAEMPGPANGWKRFSMRANRNRKVVVTLHWRALD